MKSIDDAIKHCEEVAEKNEEECKNWAYGASQINDDENRKKQYQKHAEMWQECAKEHRQLAEWLRTLKAYGEARKVIEGTIEELKKSGDNTYIKGLELAEQIIHELVDEEEYE